MAFPAGRAGVLAAPHPMHRSRVTSAGGGCRRRGWCGRPWWGSARSRRRSRSLHHDNAFLLVKMSLANLRELLVGEGEQADRAIGADLAAAPALEVAEAAEYSRRGFIRPERPYSRKAGLRTWVGRRSNRAGRPCSDRGTVDTGRARGQIALVWSSVHPAAILSRPERSGPAGSCADSRRPAPGRPREPLPCRSGTRGVADRAA